MTLFRNREDAAKKLVSALAKYQGQNPLVLAIPRGAVPMGKIIASALGGELDVVLVRKLGAPGNPELALGAIDEDGNVFLGEFSRRIPSLHGYLETEEQRQLALLRERRALYTPARPPIDPSGRIVILLDDGIATGSTMIAALHAIRMRAPARIVVATAVAPIETLHRIEREADEVVCLAVPEDFFAIGQWFDDFQQVSDETVIALLSQAASENPSLPS